MTSPVRQVGRPQLAASSTGRSPCRAGEAKTLRKLLGSHRSRPRPSPAAGDCQHRNRALAVARRARAVELATSGTTHQQIADELGYSNRRTVYRLVHNALTRELQGDVEVHRRLEHDRLDALQAPLWDRAVSGDTVAAHQVLQIRARCRLLGWTSGSRPSSRRGSSPRRGPSPTPVPHQRPHQHHDDGHPDPHPEGHLPEQTRSSLPTVATRATTAPADYAVGLTLRLHRLTSAELVGQQ